MASEEQAKKSTKALSKWLENERRIVTFRELSRELGCHVNTAKNHLLSYQKSNPNIAPTYLLSGPLKSTSKLETTAIDLSRAGSPNLNGTQSLAHLATQGVRIVDMDEMSDADRNSEDGDADELDEMGMKNDDGRPGNDEGHADGLAGVVRFKVEREDEILEPEEVPKWGVVLVQADHLELKKELFEAETLNIHIYALSPAPVKDPGLYLVPNLALREHKKYHEPTVYGTTSGDGFGLSTAMKDGEMDFSTKAPKKEEPKDSKKAAVEEKTKKQVVTQPKKEVKEEKPTKATTSKTAKPVTKAASSTNVKAKPRKRVITSDNEDGDETDKSPAPVAQASGSKSTVLGPTSSTTRADDAAAMEAMMAMDMDNDSDLEEALRGGSSAPAKKTAAVKAVKRESSTTKTGGARKKRKVKRSVTEMNDKGYMVTRDEWIEESCTDGSEDETAKKSKPAAKPKATAEPPKLVKKSSTGESSKPALSKPPPKNIAGGVKKGGQSTLAGFFKKK